MKTYVLAVLEPMADERFAALDVIATDPNDDIAAVAIEKLTELQMQCRLLYSNAIYSAANYQDGMTAAETAHNNTVRRIELKMAGLNNDDDLPSLYQELSELDELCHKMWPIAASLNNEVTVLEYCKKTNSVFLTLE